MMYRAATPSDASSLAALSIEVWVGTYLKEGVAGHFAEFALAEFTVSKMAGLVADPTQVMVVAQDSGGLVGFIRLSLGVTAPVSGCGDVEIATLYVQPRHHGKGIGKRLLAEGMAQVEGGVWLATNAQNDPAIAFYLHSGFRKMGETHFCIGEEKYLNNVYARDAS